MNSRGNPDPPERRGLPGKGELLAALAAEQPGDERFVSVGELEPAGEWRDRRVPTPRALGVTGRLRALLGTKDAP